MTQIPICNVTIDWQGHSISYQTGINEACGGNYHVKVFPDTWQTLTLTTLDNVLRWLANEYNNIAVYAPASITYQGKTYTPSGVTGQTATPSKEYVFEFSGTLLQSSLVVSAINKIVTLLGGTSVYIEDGTKLVVVV